MKKFSLAFLVLPVLLLVAATVQTITTANVKDLLTVPSVGTTSTYEVVGISNGVARRFAVAQIVAPSNMPTLTQQGIQTGTVTTSGDGTVTNVFSSAFASPPTVVIAQDQEPCTTTNYLMSVTASQFIYGAGASGVMAKWVAIGTADNSPH